MWGGGVAEVLQINLIGNLIKSARWVCREEESKMFIKAVDFGEDKITGEAGNY